MDRIRRPAAAVALALFTVAWLVAADNGLSWQGGAFSLPLAAVPFLLAGALALFLMRSREHPLAPPGAAWALAAALLLYLFSDYAAYKWFFWISVPYRNLLVKAALLFTPFFLLRRRPVPASAVLVLLVAAEAWLTWRFMETTGGAPLQRDDHPSFFYRLQLLRETYPQIISYDPRWNGGRIASELLQTGILTVAPFFLPLGRLLSSVPMDRLYTPFLAFLFHWLFPWLFYLGLRLFGADRPTALWGGLLSLYPNRYFFINLLPWGVFPSLLAMGLIVPAGGALYRITVLRDRGWAAPLVLALSLLLASFWPASFFTFLPLGIIALAALPRLDRAALLRLGGAVALFALLVSPWLMSLLASGELTKFSALEAARSPQLDWSKVANNLEHLNYVSPLLLVFGLPGALALPDRRLRRWILFFSLLHLPLLAFGNEFRAQYQFLRLVNALSFVYLVPSAFWLGRIFAADHRRDAPLRALALASVFLTVVAAAHIWSNRGLERYTVRGAMERDLVSFIETDVPPSARLFWAGKTMHGFGSGHVAPLPYLTGRMMMASDFYHFHINEMGGTYDLVPPFYLKGEGSVERTERWFDHWNVSHVSSVEGRWIRYFDDHPELYELAWEHRDGDFWVLVYRRRAFRDSLFETGSGTVDLLPGRIRVTLDDTQRGSVLRFRWLEGLATEPPVELAPHPLPGGVTLMAVPPGSPGTFEVFRPRWW